MNFNDFRYDPEDTDHTPAKRSAAARLFRGLGAVRTVEVPRQDSLR
jgi:hypothetical protein